MARKPKPTTITLDAIYTALRAQANQALAFLPGWIADAKKRYADWPATSHRDEYLREAIDQQASWTWGQLLGIRDAVYGIRALIPYATADYQRFDALASDIDIALDRVSKDARRS